VGCKPHPAIRSSRKQPEQAMEETKCLKPSDSGSRNGDRASVQAATRVNAEACLEKVDVAGRPGDPFRGRLTRLGEKSEEYTQLLHRG